MHIGTAIKDLPKVRKESELVREWVGGGVVSVLEKLVVDPSTHRRVVLGVKPLRYEINPV